MRYGEAEPIHGAHYSPTRGRQVGAKHVSEGLQASQSNLQSRIVFYHWLGLQKSGQLFHDAIFGDEFNVVLVVLTRQPFFENQKIFCFLVVE